MVWTDEPVVQLDTLDCIALAALPVARIEAPGRAPRNGAKFRVVMREAAAIRWRDSQASAVRCRIRRQCRWRRHIAASELRVRIASVEVRGQVGSDDA